MTKFEGYTKQNGTPTPDNPVPINTEIEVIINGEKKIIPINKVALKEGDYITKIKGKWYLVIGIKNK